MNEKILDDFARKILTDKQWDEDYQGMILFDKISLIIEVLNQKRNNINKILDK